jgi:hypothetical protein
MVAEVDGAVGKDDPWPSQALMTIVAAIVVALSSLLRIMSNLLNEGWDLSRVWKR